MTTQQHVAESAGPEAVQEPEPLRDDRQRLTDSDARYARRFPGWHRSRSPYCCPRQVAGLRCLAYHARRGRCICEQYAHAPLDHARLWVVAGREHILTAEPYHISDDVLDAFRRDCAEIGVHIECSDDSPYAPGSTVLLILRRTR